MSRDGTTPEDKLRELLQLDAEEEAAGKAAVREAAARHKPRTVEEAKAILAKAGVDVEAAVAKGRREHEEGLRIVAARERAARAQSSDGSVRAVEARAWGASEPWYRRFGGAFAAAAVFELAGLLWAGGRLTELATAGIATGAVPGAAPSHYAPPPTRSPFRIDQAGEACAAKQFQLCLAILDEIDAADGGEASNALARGLRAAAMEAMANEKDRVKEPPTK
jgi:hypothetical protein